MNKNIKQVEVVDTFEKFKNRKRDKFKKRKFKNKKDYVQDKKETLWQ